MNYTKLLELTNLPIVEDIPISYTGPSFTDLRETNRTVSLNGIEANNTPLYIPSRLNAPLIRLPPVVNNLVMGKSAPFNSINKPTLANLATIRLYLNKKNCMLLENSMNDLLRFFSEIEPWINEKLLNYKQNHTKLITTWLPELVNMDYNSLVGELHTTEGQYSSPNIPGMMFFWQKVRHFGTQLWAKAGDKCYNDTEIQIRFSIDNKGGYLIEPSDSMWSFYLCKYLAVITFNGRAMIVPSTYIDYLFTRCEVVFNMSILATMHTNADVRRLIKYVGDLAFDCKDYASWVQLMKNFEPYLCMLADFKCSYQCSFEPFKAVILDMIHYSNLLGPPITFDEVLLILGKEVSSHSSILGTLTVLLTDVSPLHLLECSSLHKFIAYAEVNEEEGFKKFYGRTHTQRIVDSTAVTEMISLFNKLYILGYMAKHNAIPKIAKFIVVEGKQVNDADLVERIAMKLRLLSTALTKSRQPLENLPLHWWHDLRPFDCEDKMDTASPVEQCKDKRSCREEIKNSLLDSERELEYIVRNETVQYRDFTLEEIRRDAQKSSSYVVNQGTILVNTRKPAMLKAKEREQKSEGRLFGMNTTRSKQTVSRDMEYCKHVLSYFEGNVMTPSDKKRKLKLHKMAQELLVHDSYAVLADIEGHNQSMQYCNTGELFTSVGLVFGQLDWEKYALYFNTLHVFYACQYTNNAYISRGQLGGIEGWYNPLWTLHSTLVCQLLSYRTTLDIKDIAVYSDDIALVVRIENFEENRANLLRTLRDHFHNYGMTLKGSQTMITKSRITMLRSHYIAGVRADSALKRMLAISTGSNSNFHADTIELDSLNSGITSALELSNSTVPQTVMKWIRALILLLPSFTTLLAIRVSQAWFTNDILPKSVEAIYRQHYRYDDSPTEIQDWRQIDYTIAQRVLQRAVPLTAIRRHQMRSDLFYKLTEERVFVTMFALRAVLPSSTGGLGLLTLAAQSISGMEDTFKRALLLSRECARYLHKGDQVLKMMLDNGLNGRGSDVTFREEEVLSAQWPLGSRVNDIYNAIKRSLLGYFKTICRNAELKELLRAEEQLPKLKAGLVDCFRGKYSYRIGNFYYTHSIVYIIDKLLRKVESTSSLLRILPGFKRLCEAASRDAIVAGRRLFCDPDFTILRITDLDSIERFLFERRGIMYPGITFIEVCEPDPCSQLTLKGDIADFMVVGHSTNRVAVGGLLQYQAPVFGNEALYKGEINSGEGTYENLSEYLAVRLLSVTKWIIYRSDPSNYTNNIGKSLGLISAANIALYSLGYESFCNLESYVPLLMRSEVLHRIPYIGAVTSSSIRVLPFRSPTYKAVLNNRLIQSLGLMDSNIHFDYWKNYMILRQCILEDLGVFGYFQTRYDVSKLELIHDVQYDFLTTIDVVDERCGPRLDRVTQPRPHRIQWLCGRFDADGAVSGVCPAIEYHELDYATIADELICDHYRVLRKEHLWEANPLFGELCWKSLINSHRILFEKCNLTTMGSIYDRLIRSFNRTKRKQVTDDILEVLKANLRSVATRLDNELAEEEMNDMLALFKSVLIGHTVLDKRLLEISDQCSVHLADVFRKMFKDLMIDYALVFVRDKQGWVIDEIATLASFSDFFLRLPLIDELMKSAYRTFGKSSDIFIGPEAFELQMLLRELFSDFESLEPELMITNILPKNSDQILIPLQTALKCKIIPMKCKAIRMQLHDLMSNVKLADLLMKWERYTSLRSGVGIFKSTMASDTSTIANSLLNHLMQQGFLMRGNRVLDLTAGRGEFMVEAHRLNLEVQAYGRLDEFVRMGAVEGISRLEDYKVGQLLEISEISYALSQCAVDLVVLDLSYGEHLGTELLSAMVSLVHMGASFLARLIPLTGKQLAIHDLTELKGIEVDILYVEDGNCVSPTIYLYWNQQKANTVSFKEFEHRLVTSLDNLRQRRDPDVLCDGNMVTSSMQLLNLEKGIFKMTDEFLSVTHDSSVIRLKQFFYKYINIYKAWMVGSRELPGLKELASEGNLNLALCTIEQLKFIRRLANSRTLRKLSNSIIRLCHLVNCSPDCLESVIESTDLSAMKNVACLRDIHNSLIGGYIFFIYDVMVNHPLASRQLFNGLWDLYNKKELVHCYRHRRLLQPLYIKYGTALRKHYINTLDYRALGKLIGEYFLGKKDYVVGRMITSASDDVMDDAVEIMLKALSEIKADVVIPVEMMAGIAITPGQQVDTSGLDESFLQEYGSALQYLDDVYIDSE